MKWKSIVDNWLPFAIFFATCAILGNLKLFSKALVPSMLILLAVSAFLVYLLEKPRFK